MTIESADHAGEKEAVAISSVLASGGMAAVKLAVGLMTGSLGLLSEAAHSLLDLGAASLTWFAVRVGDRPADEDHPYGHGKVENVSALIETGLLFLTSAWIVKEAVVRLMGGRAEVETTWYAVAVLVGSILVDFFRARALTKVAKKTGSQALEADALHFSSDIWSSTVVLIGLGLVALGFEKGDALAAIGVAGFVCLAGWRLGKRTIDALIDTAPEGVAEQVRGLALAVPGVALIERIRARPVGAVVHVEVVIKVGRGMSFEQVQAIRDHVRAAIRRELPRVDPLVVAEPLTLGDEEVAETVRVAAARLGLAVHGLGLYTLDQRRHVGFDLEVDDSLPLHEAHAISCRLEDVLTQELGGDVAIDIHIDPRQDNVAEGRHLAEAEQARILKLAEEVVAAHPPATGVGNFFAQYGPGGLYIAFQSGFPGMLPVKTVHDVTASIEWDLRGRLGTDARVVVHAEPESEAHMAAD